jgi:hypothetical protein
MRYRELANALDAGYPLDIEFAAGDLAAEWFEAVKAIKVLHDRAASARTQEGAAMVALRASHQVLIDLFGRAVSSPSAAAELPRLRDVLRELGARIEQAITYEP